MAEYARQTDENARLIGIAQRAEAIKDYDVAQQSSLAADAAKLAADKALQAADAFKASKEQLIAADRIAFDLGRSRAGNALAVQQRTKDFNNVGATPYDLNEQRKGGFASFDAALDEFARQTDLNTKAMADAQLAQVNKDERAVRSAQLVADASARAAAKAGEAADAFHASAETLHASIAGAAASLVGKLGAAGDVISGAAQGFSSGGPVGAIIGAIAAIVSKLEAFGRVSDSMNAYLTKFLAMIDKTFGPMIDGFVNKSEAFTELTKMVLETSGAMEIIRGVTTVLGKVFDLIALSILYTAKFFADIAGGNKAINDKIKDTLYDLQKDPNKVVAPPPPLPTGPAVSSIDKLGNAAATAAEKFGEMNTNMPSGYKLGAARFYADNGTSYGPGTGAVAGSGPGGSGGTVLQSLLSGEAAGQTTYKSSTGYGPNDQVSQDQRSESTRPGGGSGGGAYTGPGAMTLLEAETWGQVFTQMLGLGLSVAQARQAADAAVASLRAGTIGSSSSAATAASGGGGVINIGKANAGPQQTAAAAGGDTINNFYLDKLLFEGAHSLDDFIRLIIARMDVLGGRRNPARSRTR